MPAKGEQRELEHNLAVIDLFAGKAPQAESVFDELGPRPPEALVNLGILRDRQGESKKALELYSRPASAARARRSWRVDRRERAAVRRWPVKRLVASGG